MKVNKRHRHVQPKRSTSCKTEIEFVKLVLSCNILNLQQSGAAFEGHPIAVLLGLHETSNFIQLEMRLWSISA
ncbi:hypothetical protein BHS07_22720 [Myxococcus xanthus]|nr:hypothetical protein BHS07_22720 [Myxococcus xanthus]